MGELLDPVNDAVERLSSAIVWAIGSLLLQRIVLEIAASPVFKWGFLALGVAAISALLLFGWERSRNVLSRTLAFSEVKLDGFQDLMIRAFVIAALFRFIVPVFIAISFLISQVMLESEINENKESLSSFSAQVAIDTTLGSVDDQRLGEQRAHKESELEDLKRSLASLEKESVTLDERIDEAQRRSRLGRMGSGSARRQIARRKAGIREDKARGNWARNGSGPAADRGD